MRFGAGRAIRFKSALVDLALERGGLDNITVIVVRPIWEKPN